MKKEYFYSHKFVQSMIDFNTQNLRTRISELEAENSALKAERDRYKSDIQDALERIEEGNAHEVEWLLRTALGGDKG